MSLEIILKVLEINIRDLILFKVKFYRHFQELKNPPFQAFSQPPPEEDLLVTKLKQTKRTDTLPRHHHTHLPLPRGDALREVGGGEVQGLMRRAAGGHTDCCSAGGEEDGEKDCRQHLTVSSLKY